MTETVLVIGLQSGLVAVLVVVMFSKTRGRSSLKAEAISTKELDQKER